MNIFYLDESPNVSAQWLVDKHVVKMILETAQLLCTAHRVLDGKQIDSIKNGRKYKNYILEDFRDDILYKATHVNHPSSVWARESVENYLWLVEHFFALGDEYTHRYDKRHKSIIKLGLTVQNPPHGLRDWDMTKMPCAMPEEYIVSDDPITNYREYYSKGKTDLHTWTNRDKPDWI